MVERSEKSEPAGDASGTALSDAGERRSHELARLRRLVVAYEKRLRALEAENAAKVDFLARMSHELRTPLNAIAGYADLLVQEIYGPLTDEQRQALDRLQVGERLLMTLITDILSYSRIEAGRIEYKIEALSLDAALEEVRDVILPQAEAKDIRYHVVCSEGVRVIADRERLGQILLNLLSNAVKFTPSQGVIQVSGGVEDVEGSRQVRIDVTDSGCGIPAEDVGKIFHPFIQLAERQGSEEQGVGLGLAISRDLARQMKGDIHVHSVPGQGSTFTLLLPRAVEAGAGDEAVGNEATAENEALPENEGTAPLSGPRLRTRKRSRAAAAPPA